MKYEIGPIRPPSEAQSLLIRVTRGCHWNKCKFCGLYKNCKFSMRSQKDILEDIKRAREVYKNRRFTSCFLQDSDAFVLSTNKLLPIVEAIKSEFPEIKYITSYARADSILRKNLSEMKELKDAGLNHLYCGMESGSDHVLKLVNKGSTGEQMKEAGILAKEAGMILSEFILLGLGGKKYSDENAIQTAEVLNCIEPDYIRVHATAIKPEPPLGEMLHNGEFLLQSEEEIVMEQRLFLEKLHSMNSYYVNEHIVNLLLEVRGSLKNDKKKMLAQIDCYLNMSPEDKENFAIGRRINQYFCLDDMKIESQKKSVSEYIQKLKVKGADIDMVCNLLRAKTI